jgi:hypothetical protein
MTPNLEISEQTIIIFLPTILAIDLPTVPLTHPNNYFSRSPLWTIRYLCATWFNLPIHVHATPTEEKPYDETTGCGYLFDACMHAHHTSRGRTYLLRALFAHLVPKPNHPACSHDKDARHEERRNHVLVRCTAHRAARTGFACGMRGNGVTDLKARPCRSSPSIRYGLDRRRARE